MKERQKYFIKATLEGMRSGYDHSFIYHMGENRHPNPDLSDRVCSRGLHLARTLRDAETCVADAQEFYLVTAIRLLGADESKVRAAGCVVLFRIPQPLYADYSARRKQLNDDYSARLKPLNDDYSARLKPLYADYDARIKQLDDDYSARLKQLDDDYDARRKQLDADYSARLKPLYADYDARLKQLNDDYDARLKQLDADYDARLKPLYADYDARRKQLDDRTMKIILRLYRKSQGGINAS